MNIDSDSFLPSRRNLLRMIGLTAGSAAMYQAMSSLGFAAESTYRGPIELKGAPKDASVLILGAGIAGMTAAYELRNAGYHVQVLEYNDRAGGRNWTLRGGDEYTELGGLTQRCEFDKDLYLNPGPWRIPYHHRGLLSYCKRLAVPLEAFVQVNYNAYLHSSRAFGGKPQRYREIKADYQGHVAELLAKATRQQALDAAVSREDQEKLLESLRDWGALDKSYAYAASHVSSERRGFQKNPGGGLTARPVPSTPIGLADILDSKLWQGIPSGDTFDMQTALFQPVGGMGRIGEAFGRELAPLIRYHAKVTEIHQDERHVTVSVRQPDSSAVSQRIRQRRRGGMAPIAVHHGLLWHVERRCPRRALRRFVPHRWTHRAGGRTCIVHRRLAGRGGDLGARRHRPLASARGGAAGSQGMRLALCRLAARHVAAVLLTVAACARADDSTFTSTAGLSAAGGADISVTPTISR
jgi:monoamine oxidase